MRSIITKLTVLASVFVLSLALVGNAVASDKISPTDIDPAYGPSRYAPGH